MSFSWDKLDYWQSKEWLDAQDKLDALEAAKIRYCPLRENLFRSLDLTPYDMVRVCIVAQDPYPDPGMATGVAFSVHGNKIPASLKNILIEYDQDLGYGFPDHGCLENWCNQGVLLWNAIPTCQAWLPCSHRDWPEWLPLTQEIVERLNVERICFVLVGSVSHSLDRYIDPTHNVVIKTSHPSPRGQWHAKSKFVGQRLFSTINSKLCDMDRGYIDWRL